MAIWPGLSAENVSPLTQGRGLKPVTCTVPDVPLQEMYKVQPLAGQIP